MSREEKVLLKRLAAWVMVLAMVFQCGLSAYADEVEAVPGETAVTQEEEAVEAYDSVESRRDALRQGGLKGALKGDDDEPFEVASGNFRTNGAWFLDSAGELVVCSSDGQAVQMEDFNRYDAPWYPYYDQITVLSLQSVSEIGQYAFSDLTSLTTVYLDGVFEIRSSAFLNCSALSDVTYNGSEADWERVWIESGNIPLLAAELHTIDAPVSGDCGWNMSWSYFGGMLSISGNGKMDDFNLGETPWQDYAQYITSVSIGDEVTWVGEYAFYGCRSLSNVYIGASVETIGSHAFERCTSLQSSIFLIS